MLTLNQQQIDFLTKLSHQMFEDFCRLTKDYFEKEPNYKLYSTLSEKVGLEPDEIKSCVEGLMNIVIEGVKSQLNVDKFKEMVVSMGFSDGKESLLGIVYENVRKDVQCALETTGLKLPEYYNLEWRFETQIASRSLLKQTVPMMTLDLQLKNTNDADQADQHVAIQSDVSNLLHLTKELEAAMQEGKSKHLRLVRRAVK